MLEKREPSLHCWWECKLVLCSHYVEQYGGSLELKIKQPLMIQQSCSWVYTPRKPQFKKTQATQYSLKHYL